MTLGETILYYRKRAQLSQETLAEIVGVSRQAVSKWELDEAVPEVGKLQTLAGAFHVTVDQLLSGQPAEETAPPQPTPPAPPTSPARPDHLSLLGRLIRRWGWLAGVYVALSGGGVVLVGTIARYAFRQMFAITMGDMFGDFSDFGGFGLPSGQMTVGISQMGQVFVNIATFIMILGILIVIAGVVLAIVLWRRGRQDKP